MTQQRSTAEELRLEREAAERRRASAIDRARQYPATSVPTARIGKPAYQEDRGAFRAVIDAPSRRAFDLALGGALGLPPPETPPPRVSKEDGR